MGLTSTMSGPHFQHYFCHITVKAEIVYLLVYQNYAWPHFQHYFSHITVKAHITYIMGLTKTTSGPCFQHYSNHITATAHIIIFLGFTSTRPGPEVSCQRTLAQNKPRGFSVARILFMYGLGFSSTKLGPT